MNDDLLDTSWTLHYVPAPTQSYHNILKSLSTTELQNQSDRLIQYLASHRPQYKDDLEDENERLGSLRECKWSSFTSPPSALNSTFSSTTSISIHLSYQNQPQPYKYILYSPYLLLTKSPPTHTSRLFSYLNHAFDLDIQPNTHILKLTPPFLSSTLSSYLTNLLESFTRRPDDLDIDESNRTFVLRAAINNLKLTISFSGPIAPELRSVEIDVPFESIESLISISTSASTTNSSTTLPISAVSNSNATTITTGTHFLTNLSHYLTQQTGLKLPLLFPSSSSLSSEESGSTAAAAAIVRLSKITTSAFAISSEGKIKLSRRALENAVGHEDLVRSVNGRMMGKVESEARRRSTGDSAADED